MNLGFTAIIFSELDVIRSKEHKLILRGIYMGEKRYAGLFARLQSATEPQVQKFGRRWTQRWVPRSRMHLFSKVRFLHRRMLSYTRFLVLLSTINRDSSRLIYLLFLSVTNSELWTWLLVYCFVMAFGIIWESVVWTNRSFRRSNQICQ